MKQTVRPSPMMNPSKAHGRLVWVRDKETGEIDIRRAGEHASDASLALPSLQKNTVHFTDKFCHYACRCSDRKRHYISNPIGNNSTHDACRVIRFLDRTKREQCSMREVRIFEAQQKAEWANKGVYAETFHYMTEAKDLVCRCTKLDGHARGIVRNPEIIELCAEFFCIKRGLLKCSKQNWRDHRTVITYAESPRSDSFKYDSVSTHALINKLADGVSDSPRKETLASGTKQVTIELHANPDIPEQVWNNARPAAWTDQCTPASSASTPIGTPPIPPFPTKSTTHKTRISRPTSLKLSNRASADTCWTNIQREAARLESTVLNDQSEHVHNEGQDNAAAASSNPLDDFKGKVAGAEDEKLSSPVVSWTLSPPVSPETSPQQVFSNSGSQSSSGGMNLMPNMKTRVTIVPELPTGKSPVEMAATKPRVHTATLRELEGYQYEHAVEMPGKSDSMDTTLSSEKSNSQPPQVFTRFSFRFGVPHDVKALPDQEDFLLRELIPCSRTFPAPAGNCSFCNESYSGRIKKTVYIPNCRHYIHEQCLIAHFRRRDQVIGTCPFCGTGICQRGLADRIETDRIAIFGQQHTHLAEEACIVFPHRDEAARLQSGEELAAAQLRSLKDYIDIHAEDLWLQWETSRKEPNWYADIIRPVIQLFKGWSKPWQKSRYFCDRDAFLKLVAWSELVRLMNVMRLEKQRSQHGDGACPSLAELHQKFAWAKERYEKEKKTWKLSAQGALYCDKIAQDVFDLAMRSHDRAQ